jgi:hypothetical protein
MGKYPVVIIARYLFLSPNPPKTATCLINEIIKIIFYVMN